MVGCVKFPFAIYLLFGIRLFSMLFEHGKQTELPIDRMTKKETIKPEKKQKHALPILSGKIVDPGENCASFSIFVLEIFFWSAAFMNWMNQFV